MGGAQKSVLCWEVVPFSEGPLSEIPLYCYLTQKCADMILKHYIITSKSGPVKTGPTGLVTPPLMLQYSTHSYLFICAYRILELRFVLWWNGMECNGVEWSRVELLEWNGMGVEWNGSGVQWVEWGEGGRGVEGGS